MPIIKMPALDSWEKEALLQGGLLCRIAFQSPFDTHPYISPFLYVYHGGSLYFFFSSYGKKLDFLQADPRVCVEVEETSPDFSVCQFLSLRGELQVVEESTERQPAMDALKAKATERKVAPSFLTALGLPREATWSSFSAADPILVVKLTRIVEQVGLKT